MGAALRAHVQFAKTSGYRGVTLMTREETRCLRQTGLLDVTDICEVGPGDGYHSVALLSHAVHSVPERYLALDVSDYLLGLTRSRFAQLFPKTDTTMATWDFEAGGTAAIAGWRRRSNILILFLGQTLGNTRTPGLALANLRASAEAGDVLLISVACLNETMPAANYLLPYRSQAFADGNIASLQPFGIDADRASFRLEWHDRAVFGTVRIAEPLLSGHSVLPPGADITTFYSKRFTTESLTSIFDDTGWQVTHESIVLGSSHIAALARAV